jgi:hypothetical protein
MCLSMVHLLHNMAQAQNTGWQLQGNFNRSFNLCAEDFCFIGFCMSSIGAKFNQVSVSVVSGENKAAYHFYHKATKGVLFQVYEKLKRCGDGSCCVCAMVEEQDSTVFKDYMAGPLWQQGKFPLDRPSSDNNKPFFGFAKEEFGQDAEIQQT